MLRINRKTKNVENQQLKKKGQATTHLDLHFDAIDVPLVKPATDMVSFERHAICFHHRIVNLKS